MCQFHQRFKISFSTQKYLKVQKDADDLTVFFARLRSERQNAARKMLVQLTLGETK